jgi:hypothetical protein
MVAEGRIPIILAIDVEPDNRHDPPGSGVDITGLRRTIDVLSALRPRLEAATEGPVVLTWFVRMDPQVAAQGNAPDALLAAAPDLVDAIEAAGDVIGLHTHAGRWDPGRRSWLADHADERWIDHCLDSGFEAFAARLGRPCREHRFGDRFSSPAVYRRLANLGAVVDLTPEPGQPSVRRASPIRYATGRIPSYARTARSPQLVADGSLWLLPLTSADPAPALPRARRWLRRLRYLGQPLHRTLLLDRAWPSPALFWDLAEDQLARGARHLAFAIRSDLVLQPRWTATSGLLEDLLRRPLARSLTFVGGEAAIRLAVG